MLALVLVMHTFQHPSAETHLCQGAAVLSVPAFCNCTAPRAATLAIPCLFSAL